MTSDQIIEIARSISAEDPISKNYAEDLRSIGLTGQARQIEGRERGDKIEAAGLKRVTLEKIVKDIMGSAPDVRLDTHRYASMRLEWSSYENITHMEQVYFHKKTWYGGDKWTCIAGPLAALKLPPPRGVVLTIKELRDRKTFDFFMAVAPAAAFRDAFELDPVLVGGICPVPTRGRNQDSLFMPGLSTVEYFELARWDKIG